MVQEPAGNETPAEVAARYRQKYPWADIAAIDVCVAIRRCEAAQDAAAGRLFSSLGPVKSLGRYTLLRTLYFADEFRLSQVQLVNTLNVTSANVTYLVDVLEKEGLLERLQNASDRRVMDVRLTPDGIVTCEKLVPAITMFMAQLNTGFSDEEKAVFFKLLERFFQNAEAFGRE